MIFWRKLNIVGELWAQRSMIDFGCLLFLFPIKTKFAAAVRLTEIEFPRGKDDMFAFMIRRLFHYEGPWRLF